VRIEGGMPTIERLMITDVVPQIVPDGLASDAKRRDAINSHSGTFNRALSHEHLHGAGSSTGQRVQDARPAGDGSAHHFC